jgi:hypothetical protein
MRLMLKHGRPQTFFQGRAQTYYLPKKHLKTHYFPLKKSKNILFWPAREGGKGPLLPSPALAPSSCGRPCAKVSYITQFHSKLQQTSLS